MSLVIYRGTTNNSIHTFYGERTLDNLLEQHRIKDAFGNWDEAHRRIPNVGPIATFTKQLYPVQVGYVTGTFGEFDRWVKQFGLKVVMSPVENSVPLSNGDFEKHLKDVLTDAEFQELFGHPRPADSLSHPRWRRG